MLLSFQMGLNMGSALALLVGIFLVYNTIAIGVVQRRRGDRHVARARSNRQSDAAAVHARSGAARPGGPAPLPLGWLIARRAIAGVADAISSVYVQVHATSVHLAATEVIIGFALGVLGSCFAAFRPASAAASVAPVEALRKSVSTGHVPERQYTIQLALGSALLVAAFGCLYLPPPVENLPLGGYLAVFCVLMGATALTPSLIRRAHRVLAAPAHAGRRARPPRRRQLRPRARTLRRARGGFVDWHRHDHRHRRVHRQLQGLQPALAQAERAQLFLRHQLVQDWRRAQRAHAGRGRRGHREDDDRP